MPGPRPDKMPFAEFRVPAAAPLTLLYGYSWAAGGYNHGCTKVVSFSPAAGQAYEFTGVTIESQRKCGVGVIRIDATPEPVVLQEAPRCTS